MIYQKHNIFIMNQDIFMHNLAFLTNMKYIKNLYLFLKSNEVIIDIISLCFTKLIQKKGQ